MIAALVGGLLAAAAAFFLARRIARPVARVAAASRSLAAGRHPEPVPVEGAAELATLAGRFNDLAEQLARAREAERSFLLSVSHELKTPLTAIRGYAEALREGAVTPDGRRPRRSSREAERLERLVGDLLDLARMNRTEFAVHPTEIDLAEVAGDAVRRYEPQAAAFGVSLLGGLGRLRAGVRRRRPRAAGRLEPRRERAAPDSARRRGAGRHASRASCASRTRAPASPATTARTPSSASTSTRATAGSGRSAPASVSRSSRS